ncbi:hypothetical protein J3L18_17180 [Mucilaginibacter gossypii]|uniref:baeRF3 domain-containing protein n=1 Tax=Mucilaginibacter gossypii TaxID=551996 RepID=UPI000DCDEC81|nr:MULTISPECIES: hypothetical protein [Mucilaginibacter]QTE34883.1 hypothetical protein J3L18_17180 [Mucilaginibacter gossypii]RAV59604.1 hypothetical protein DIU36_05095 [Mucilaginibacter rubeus]
MKTQLSPDIIEVLNALHYRPALSLILPMDAQVSLKAEIAHKLKIAADNAARELRRDYPEEQCALMTKKLQSLLEGLILPADKKGIAIYVSPVFEKVLYTDCSVTEKLVIDESFEIRDLLYDAKQHHKVLLLVLSGQETKIFLGDRGTLQPLPSNIPQSIYDYVPDGPERIGNFSDVSEHKQVVVDNFLRHIDEELGNLIHEYSLPVLLLGAERILGHFGKISKHTSAIIGQEAGNYEHATLTELQEVIAPCLASLQKQRECELLVRLDEAAGQQRLAKGVYDVWRAAAEGKGQLLVVERNYSFLARHSAEPGMIEALTEPYDHFSYIRDAVDDALEKVLKGGGDAEFVADGVLGDFGHVALVKYYAP